MSGETESNVSGWTTDTLKQYVDGRFIGIANLADERDVRYQQRFAAQEKGTETALVSVNERLSLLNELRSGVATKEHLDGIERRVDDMKERLDRNEGHGKGLNDLWGYLVGAVGVALAIYANVR